MRRFNVTVNGTPYIVDIEEITGSAPVYQAPVAAPAVAPAPVAAPAAPAAPAEAAPAPAPVAAAPADGFKFTSPMPGTLVKYIVKDGAQVNKGEPAFILESMKMENEIVAPADGKITFLIREGAMINAGDVVAVIS
ncbi:MAG: acetyl-CoA carboxylase biotin carboxyl carrier protein subunit [Clostridiales bacterium]|jgi:biotin carboxyl carrier protein|nr:acetyl-CoA carboxylase biotin carboxyl carrier protein subunit [Clostridiales bacterium]HOB65024.1 acetyl-CoA carboxylase biotin carboxyl carrier protein subunit [Clostridia bacterium]HPO53450.1 acetyl-CoA carboxylase biotin carboxyl carrier protein subunit [Clostridia bacterium]